MASPTWWAWVWVNSGSWWWTGRPGVLWFMGSQRVRHDWVSELNWADRVYRKTLIYIYIHYLFIFTLFISGHFPCWQICNRYNKVLFSLNKLRYNTIIIFNSDDSKELTMNQFLQCYLETDTLHIYKLHTHTHISIQTQGSHSFSARVHKGCFLFFVFPSLSGIRWKFLRFLGRPFISQKAQKEEYHLIPESWLLIAKAHFRMSRVPSWTSSGFFFSKFLNSWFVLNK